MMILNHEGKEKGLVSLCGTLDKLAKGGSEICLRGKKKIWLELKLFKGFNEQIV